MIVIADTSVILNLCCVQQQELLRALFREVVVPPGVRQEFERAARVYPRFAALRIPTWIREQPPCAIPENVRHAPRLDAGEMAAIALALEIAADAVLIDETDGRRAARQLGLITIGVAGICRENLRLYFVNRAGQFADPPSSGSSRREEALISNPGKDQSLVTSAATWEQRISRLFKEIEPDDGFSEAELKTLRDLLTPTEAKRCLEVLNSLRTLDPAVGSGAFPVGLPTCGSAKAPPTPRNAASWSRKSPASATRSNNWNLMSANLRSSEDWNR